jgi:quercetin 2,3-dioxygenase
MDNDRQKFVREVARIDDPSAVAGQMDGHRARRLIDADDNAFSDPFLLMAEDWTPRGSFALHPHRGLETVTFVIEGLLEHFDNAGHGGTIQAGDAQWMTAGRGVLHEENPPQGMVAHTLQLWVNLPAAQKMTDPRYQDLVAAAMPVRREDGVEVRVFSGKSADLTSATLNHVPVTMLEVRIEPGASFRHELPATDNVFVYLLEGQLRVGGARAPVKSGQLAWLTRSDGQGSSEITLAAEDTASRVLVFAGRPLREPVAFGGPFVMNTQAEIRQAFADYRAGRFQDMHPPAPQRAASVESIRRDL